jgi:hypothetical protein
VLRWVEVIVDKVLFHPVKMSWVTFHSHETEGQAWPFSSQGTRARNNPSAPSGTKLDHVKRVFGF